MASRPLSRFLGLLSKPAQPYFCSRCSLGAWHQVRRFSASPQRGMMDISCFTPEQLMVRDAIAKICSNFPDVRAKILSI